MTLTEHVAAGLRAVGYLRVSTDEQAEAGYSLPEQKERIEEYCRENRLSLVDTISDDFTGKLLERPGLKRVSRLAEAGAFDLLIAVKLDRLARANHLRRHYEEWLSDCGIQVRYVQQTFEETASGRLQKGIMGEFGEYEWELIRERTMAGKLKRARDGQVMPICMRTFGYRYVTRAEAAVLPEFFGRAGELLPVEEEATLVREVFSRFAGGASLREVARWLNQTAFKPRRSESWSPSTVQFMLRNETYVGRAHYGRLACTMSRELTSAGTVRIQRSERPRDEWASVPCPALISEDLYTEAQRRLTENRERASGRPSQVWPLSGVVLCGRCLTRHGTPRRCHGSTKASKWGVWRYYICRPRTGCQEHYCGSKYRADHLEAFALDALRQAATPGRLAAIAEREAEAERNSKGDPAAVAAHALQRLSDLDREEERVADLLLAGIARHIVERRLSSIHHERSELKRQLGDARTRLQASRSPAEITDHAEKVATRLALRLQEIGDDTRQLRDIFKLLLEIHLYPDREPTIRVRVPVSAEW